MAIWQANLDYVAFLQGVLDLAIALAAWSFVRAADYPSGPPGPDRRCGLQIAVPMRLAAAFAACALQCWLRDAELCGAPAPYISLLREMLSGLCACCFIDIVRIAAERRRDAASLLAAAVPAAIWAAALLLPEPRWAEGRAAGFDSVREAVLSLGLVMPAALLAATALLRRGPRRLRLPACAVAILPGAALVPLDAAGVSAVAGAPLPGALIAGLGAYGLLCSAAAAVVALGICARRREPWELPHLQAAGRRRIVRVTMVATLDVLLLTGPVLRATQRYLGEHTAPTVMKHSARHVSVTDVDGGSRSVDFARARMLVLLAAASACSMIGAVGAASYHATQTRDMWALQRTLLTSVDAALLLADQDRVVLYANAAASAIIDAADADQGGATLESLGASQGDARRRLLDGPASDGRWEGEAVSTTSEGVLVWHRLTVSAVRNREGTVAGYIAIGMDITGRKRLEDALRRSQAELLASNRTLRALLEEQCALTEQLGEREQALEREAQTDELTGLPNRRAFDQLAAKTLSSAEARGDTLAIAIVDLDDFKCINDTLGHPAGDVALAEIARILKGSLRAGDTVCRYGGDEFAIIMGVSDSARCQEACERVSAAIREQTEGICRTDGLPPLTASIGAAMYPAHGKTLKDLIASADIALYVGKNAGPGHAHVHEGWEKALRRAAV